MIRNCLTAAALAILLAGCGNAPENTDGAKVGGALASDTGAGVPNPGITTNTDSERAFAEKRYARIEDMEAAGQLRCDTLTYECAGDPRGGTLVFCYVADDLVRARHEYTVGDHGGGRETYYFDDTELFLADLTQSTWTFAPPPEDSENDGTTRTVDHVSEERRYFYNGNLIDRRYRDYQVISGEPSPNPVGEPGERTGKGVDVQLSGEQLLALSRSREFACE
ncbi:hypothetical protein [Lewinella sp. JB7]|uniref:hypothetical protein n=1 Tax=Lewinella sp. JB7 TaxID=2962887 RepID=UPI0020C951EE|nr:hypothetical protein [Lewinella sp. JB7]MCP9235121.1 hypothetical protein [Lewinella sp. JB7]